MAKINVILDYLKSSLGHSEKIISKNIPDQEKYPEEKGIAEKIIACEKILNYFFNDKNLLVAALKHRSFLSISLEERYLSNERLEFLGDAVLELITTEFLYTKYPQESEGELSKMKSILVSKKALSKVSRELNLGEYVLLNYGEEKSGGRDRDSTLANTYEAILGAMYLDSDFHTAKKFTERHLLSRSKEFLNAASLQNYKSELLEYSQSKGWGVPDYYSIQETGPDHDKEFEIGVKIGDRSLSSGKGTSKKAAEQSAARKALKILSTQNSE